MTDKETMQMALDVLENHTAIKHPQQRVYRDDAIEALRARLAQPEQKPVAHVVVVGDMVSVSTGSAGLKSLFDLGNGAPLYTTPPAAQRQWVGLTDDDYQELLGVREWGVYLIEAVEAKLKEKNA